MMRCVLLLVVVVLIVLQLHLSDAQIPLKNPHETRGVILLDAFTFPKIIPSPNHNVVVLITNKRFIGDYGTDSIRADYFSFTEFVQTRDDATTNSGQKDILFTQVIVNGADNAFLAERLGLAKDFKLPRMFLFTPGQSEPIAYPSTSPFHLQAMLRFLQQNTGYVYRIPGTLSKYDKVVKSISSYLYAADPKTATAATTEKTNNNDDEDETETKTESTPVPEKTFQDDATFQSFVTEVKGIHEEYGKQAEELPILYVDAEKPVKTNKELKITEHDMSKYYLKIIEGIAENGISFIKKEIDRVRQLFDNSKLSPVTKTKVKYQLNILKSFLNSRETLSKKEIEKIQKLPNRHKEEEF